MARPISGIPKPAIVAAMRRATSDAHGTAAIPLLMTIKTNNMVNLLRYRQINAISLCNKQ
ncbi:MAG: hypothetical protein IPO26_14030 [Saprospiraceae bacterium]|nr:hypothetical protein [Saprospiraceae bacterium]